MVRPDDVVIIKGGMAHMPSCFREIAQAANKAGLKGWEVADVEYGVDLIEARDQLKLLGDIPVVARISYKERDQPNGV